MTRAGDKLYADGPLPQAAPRARLKWRRYVLLAIVAGVLLGSALSAWVPVKPTSDVALH